MVRATCFVVLAACGAGGHRITSHVLTVDVPAPPRDLRWRGVDSRVGGYAVGACTLGYDAGMYQDGLMPGDDEADWQYRVTRVDGRAARWARYTKAVDDRTGPYWLALYVPGLRIDVTCPTAGERDAAVAWLETVRFGTLGSGDLTGTTAITGPAAWSPAPPWCEVIAGAPAGGTSQATLEITGPPGVDLSVVTVSSPAFTDTFVVDEHSEAAFTLQLPAGTYAVDVASGGTERIRCSAVELRSGQSTALRVLRFGL